MFDLGKSVMGVVIAGLVVVIVLQWSILGNYNTSTRALEIAMQCLAETRPLADELANDLQSLLDVPRDPQ